MKKILYFLAFSSICFSLLSNDNTAIQNYRINPSSNNQKKIAFFDTIAQFVLEKLNGNCNIEFTKPSLKKIDQHICAKEKIKILNIEQSKNFFKASFLINGISVPLYGSFHNMVSIPVINKKIDREIQESDISYIPIKSSDINERMIKIPQSLIGCNISKNYKPLSPIYDYHLEKPEIVKKNTKVVISIKTKNLKLETGGVLTENAKINQIASVMNLKSKRLIDCIVKSKNEVIPVGFY